MTVVTALCNLIVRRRAGALLVRPQRKTPAGQESSPAKALLLQQFYLVCAGGRSGECEFAVKIAMDSVVAL
jgi:hypothetical protein